MPATNRFWHWVAIAGLAVFCLAFVDRSCNADRELAKARAAYAENVRLLEADNAMKRDAILRAEETITQLNVEQAQLNASIVAKNAQLATQQAELEALQNAEPPTTPEVEALPIVISLRAQVARLSSMFTLSEAKCADYERIVASLKTELTAKDDIIASWRGQYENEHALRVQAEGLFKDYQRAYKANKFWRTTAIIAGAVAVGSLLTR